MKMKKFNPLKSIFLSCLFLVMILTSGCVKYSYNFEIDNKGNISVSEINAINIDLIREENPNSEQILDKKINSEKIAYENEGYKVEKYSDELFTGAKIFKKFKNTKFYTNNLPQGFSTTQKTPIIEHKGIFKKTYKIYLTYNFKDVKYITSAQRKSICFSHRKFTKHTSVVEALLSKNPGLLPVAELTIKIPKKASLHNADEVLNNNEYKWNLAFEQPTEINLEFEIINWFNIILSLFIAFTLVLLVIAIKNRNKND